MYIRVSQSELKSTQLVSDKNNQEMVISESQLPLFPQDLPFVLSKREELGMHLGHALHLDHICLGIVGAHGMSIVCSYPTTLSPISAFNTPPCSTTLC